jgi:ADP-ribosylation factor-like protein 3
VQEELLKKVPLLVFANKQDLAGALTPGEIAEGLNLFALRERAWQIEGCSAKDGVGLEQGMDWAIKQIS